MVCARSEKVARISAPVRKRTGRSRKGLATAARGGAKWERHAPLQRARHPTQQCYRVEILSRGEVEKEVAGRASRTSRLQDEERWRGIGTRNKLAPFIAPSSASRTRVGEHFHCN